jgi:uncharacterized protein YndB with AHSA1/START domain
MSSSWHQQALIESPIEAVWQLVGDPRRHPEWWPKVVEVKGLERIEHHADFRQVTRQIGGEVETTMRIEQLEEMREISLRCLDTGTFARWKLTEAQGSTFTDVEFGIEPTSAKLKVFDSTIGKRYFRRWTNQALDGLREATDRGR